MQSWSNLFTANEEISKALKMDEVRAAFAMAVSNKLGSVQSLSSQSKLGTKLTRGKSDNVWLPNEVNKPNTVVLSHIQRSFFVCRNISKAEFQQRGRRNQVLFKAI